MSDLVLTEDLAKAFLEALLAVARVDGAINPSESRVLRDIASEIGSAGGFTLDFEELLLTQRSPDGFARAVEAARAGGPFRSGSVSSPPEIAEAFVAAGRRVAEADGEVESRETRAIDHYARALTD